MSSYSTFLLKNTIILMRLFLHFSTVVPPWYFWQFSFHKSWILKSVTEFPKIVVDQKCVLYSFSSTAYTHFQNFASFFSKLYTQIQELHTQSTKCLTSLAKWSTAFKISQTTSQKQTFVIRCKHLCHNILFLDISYTHSY